MGWNYLSVPKLQRLHRWSLGMDKLFHPTLYNGCDYLSMLGLRLNHVGKSGPRKHSPVCVCVTEILNISGLICARIRTAALSRHVQLKYKKNICDWYEILLHNNQVLYKKNYRITKTVHHLDDQQHDISNSLGQFESHYPYWYRMKFLIWCRVTKEVQILQICQASNLPIVSRTVQYPLHYCNCIFDMSVAGTVTLMYTILISINNMLTHFANASLSQLICMLLKGINWAYYRSARQLYCYDSITVCTGI